MNVYKFISDNIKSKIQRIHQRCRTARRYHLHRNQDTHRRWQAHNNEEREMATCNIAHRAKVVCHEHVQTRTAEHHDNEHNRSQDRVGISQIHKGATRGACRNDGRYLEEDIRINFAIFVKKTMKKMSY